jgi:dihydrofolate synthase/folylpolyglutamate synthase
MPVVRPGTTPAYQAALDYIYSFINYEQRMPSSPQHARFNLTRLRWMLTRLGDPQDAYAKVVVAGTKGKGSTAAMIESILRAGGYRTGLFSSPHLHSWRERIQVDRELIPQEVVTALVERIKPLVVELPVELGPPTVFELATLMGFLYFADVGVQIAVLEVGLGGRYDTVNVVTPLVSVITPISYDHMAVLGSTLSEIASAKAGIIKLGVPVIVAPQAAEADAVILAEAATGAPVWRAAPDGMVPVSNVEGPDARSYPLEITSADVGLQGPHQVENARLAVGAVLVLGDRGMSVPERAYVDGLRNVRWPGRFEVVEGTPTIVIDGAMNGASAARLREGLATLPHERLILVLGTSRDKDLRAIAAELVPGASAVVLTRSRHPRSADVETLAGVVDPFLRGPLYLTDDIPPALDQARDLAGAHDLICVAGSLFVAAAAREALDLDAVVD